MKKYKYKYLTEEMRKAIDEEIKKTGRDALYEKVEHNIRVEELVRGQNKPNAFKEIHKGIWTTIKWKLDFFTKPIIIDLDSMEQEILYYIDKHRFMGWRG